MTIKRHGNLKRPLQVMPDDVLRALESRRVLGDYHARPDYQRNDYLAWIGRAKRPETRANRLDQMLSELERGGVYMNMHHPPSKKSTLP